MRTIHMLQEIEARMVPEGSQRKQSRRSPHARARVCRPASVVTTCGVNRVWQETMNGIRVSRSCPSSERLVVGGPMECVMLACAQHVAQCEGK